MDDDVNWGTSELKTDHQQAGLDVPKFKSAPPPSLPLSSSPISPSSYFPFSSSSFSPSEFLNSPMFLSSPNVSYKLLHAYFCWKIKNKNKNKCISFMFRVITNDWFFFVFMYGFLDFCISNYWGFCWSKLQLEEQFRRGQQGGWEKLLWLLFPNTN